MDKMRSRFPGVLILFTVTLLCVAVLSALCVATTRADCAMTEHYANTVDKIYACERAGQRWLSEVDGARSESGTLIEAELPPDTNVEGEIVSTVIRENGWELNASVRISGNEPAEVISWTKQAIWEEDTSLTLWQEDEPWM